MPHHMPMQALGGVRWMILSHEDDVCDHAAWQEALGCDRIIHREAVSQRQGTECVLKHCSSSRHQWR